MNINSRDIYSVGHSGFFDKIIFKKKLEILSVIKSIIDLKIVDSCLDIGTTSDINNQSSNSIIKNLPEINILKSISDQKINHPLFNLNLKKSITEDFTNDEILKMSSDLVISSATIEHVGNEKNQVKMIENMINLSKKYFVITTPNRFYPIDFHTKLPLIHWLPKNIHRILLKVVGLKYYDREENLNLLSKNDLKKMMKNFDNKVDYKIKNINLLGIVSNFIIIGEIK